MKKAENEGGRYSQSQQILQVLQPPQVWDSVRRPSKDRPDSLGELDHFPCCQKGRKRLYTGPWMMATRGSWLALVREFRVPNTRHTYRNGTLEYAKGVYHDDTIQRHEIKGFCFLNNVFLFETPRRVAQVNRPNLETAESAWQKAITCRDCCVRDQNISLSEDSDEEWTPVPGHAWVLQADRSQVI